MAPEVARMYLYAVSACTAPTADTAAAPSAYTYDASTTDETDDLAAMQADLQFVLDNIRSYNARPIIDAWYQTHRYSDELCPRETTTESEINGTVVYFDSLCVSQDRYWFKGPMTTYTFADKDFVGFDVFDFLSYLEGGDDVVWSGQAVKGQTDVFDEDSDLDFNCSCTAMRAVSSGGSEASEWLSYTDGPAHWIAPTADPADWMNVGILSHLFLRYKDFLEGDRWELTLEGSITGATAVYGEVGFETQVSGTGSGAALACDDGTELRAEARRSATGKRTPLDFTFEGGSCRACTTLDAGEVCLDLTEALDWETAPW